MPSPRPSKGSVSREAFGLGDIALCIIGIALLALMIVIILTLIKRKTS